MYTASLYAAFASLIHNKSSELDGKRVMMFSYGSGLTSTMFSLQFREGQHPFSLANIATVMNVGGKLKSRHEVEPEKFIETLKLMEHRYGGKDFVTNKDCSLLEPALLSHRSRFQVPEVLCQEACGSFGGATTVANGH
ncbi:hypothetical protein G4B88_019536 [Cannabis sativa]|uniref:Hydroxymethylglutaryl-coenzyme A synthase C-terminal domain-containing protein n=1 Tax=Cannabis sativa TaxID=3483 RepID=A0A7J6DQE4_CANSA|nr:hypothetical protein G4B88_019536 [Cannabis sativa]